jgi:hypothetical protein
MIKAVSNSERLIPGWKIGFGAAEREFRQKERGDAGGVARAL